MIKICKITIPFCVAAAVLAAIVTGEPELAKLWFSVWSLM